MKCATRDRTSSLWQIKTPLEAGEILRAVGHAPPSLENSAHFPHRQRLTTAASTLGGFPTRADEAPPENVALRPASKILHHSGSFIFLLRSLTAEEMLHALEIWRCDTAMKPAIGAARSEA